jgi:hypothetical protein
MHISCSHLLTAPSTDSQYTFLLKVQQNVYKITVKTQQQHINISILLWQHISALSENLQANIQRYEVQSVYIMHYEIPHYLQGAHKNSLKP